MTERAKFVLACEKELERLKKEEVFILELLRDVQKQLGKYKVEALHMTHVSLGNDNDEEKSGDDEVSSDNVMVPEMIDAPEIINKNKLDLELKQEDDEDDEEFEESEESEFSD